MTTNSLYQIDSGESREQFSIVLFDISTLSKSVTKNEYKA